MSNNVYDFLNKLQRWLPAVGVLYLGLCKIWGLPLGDEVNQSIVLIATFIASILEISTVQYKKEQLLAIEDLDTIYKDVNEE